MFCCPRVSTPAQGQGEGVDGGEVVRELRAELQRSLASLKDKRQRISQLQQDLHTSQDQLQQLQHDSTHSSTKLSPVRGWGCVCLGRG